MQVGERTGPEPPVEPDRATPVKLENRVKVRLSLFFDGTGNNRVNIRHGLAAKSNPESAAIVAKYGKKGSSYFNDFSNVVRLEENVQETAAEYDYYFKVYTEGIGTMDAGKDPFFGNVMGKGESGVKSRVEKGLLNGISAISKGVPKDKIIEKLSVDTFGFSRGAAAARYCVHRVLHTEEEYPITIGMVPARPIIKPDLKTRLIALGHKVEQVEVKTVGLYDTVSALGIAYIDLSDVPELRLDSIKEAKSALQLSAAEEYRVCFSLTNIDSAKRRGIGREVFLPGAHSDVGGGYVDGAGEEMTICAGSASGSIVEFLKQHGWYRERELEHIVIDSVEVRRRHEEVRVAREEISNQYSFIPLRLMADYATEQGLNVDQDLKSTYVPSMISRELRDRIEQYAKGNESKASDWQHSEPSLNALRHDFLHFSSRMAMGFHLRTLELGKGQKRPFRKVYVG